MFGILHRCVAAENVPSVRRSRQVNRLSLHGSCLVSSPLVLNVNVMLFLCSETRTLRTAAGNPPPLPTPGSIPAASPRSPHGKLTFLGKIGAPSHGKKKYWVFQDKADQLT